MSPPAPPINQSSTGSQSPNIIGDNATINYHNVPAGPTPGMMKYREQLADEIAASRKSLDKSRNRWYTASVQGNRQEAEKYWKESTTRMSESAALLREKVGFTAEG